MKIYDISRLPSSIVLGWDGENNWRPIAFDCTALLTGRSDAVVTLWLLPNGETQAFPVALERDGNTVTWTPLNEEMTAERGQLQIVVQDGTDVGKSKVIAYAVHDSLVGGADHPAETPSWATQVVADVAEQADRAEEAAESIGESIGEQLPGAIADYLEEHPVTVTETDPNVPSWAKQPNKPTYTAAEVGALPDSYTPPVTSVNGKAGAVTITASDLGALTEHQSLAAYRTASAQDTIDAAQDAAIAAKYTKPSGGIPKTDLASDVRTSLGKADTALQTAPVTSVNGMTGLVTVKTPYYLTVTTENDTIYVDKTPTEIDALSAAGYDVHFYHVLDGGGFQIRIDYRFGGYTPFAGLAALTAEYAGLSYAAIVNSDKTVDFQITDLDGRISTIEGDISTLQTDKADKTEIPTKTSDLTNDSGFITASQVPSELPTVTSTDNGKVLGVVNGAWAAQAVPFQTPRVAMTASDTTPSLSPNKLYVFPEMVSLTPTLATPSDATILNEYHFIFTSGATATTTTFPAIPGLDDFAAEADTVYEVSILEGRALVTSWEVSA